MITHKLNDFTIGFIEVPDDSLWYFIAKNQFFHKTLYRLSELLEKNNEYEITHYLPFRLPPPPNQTK